MITAKLEDEIIYIIIDGDFTYEDFLNAVNPIFKSGENYIGFISDGRKMTTMKPTLQHQLEQHHQKYNANKPNAILMNPNDGKKILAKIYVRFTNAINTKIFTDEEEAVKWVKSFRPKAATSAN